MSTSAPDAYLESWVLTADPLELVRILYRLAMDRIREARHGLETGDAAARGKAICSAAQALAELASSLDHQAGGELSRRLAQLYEYMQWRLVEASRQPGVEPLNEVLALLGTLSEAWQTFKPHTHTPSPAPAFQWHAEHPGEAVYSGAAECWSA